MRGSLAFELVACWLGRRLVVVRLAGNSMAPTLRPGDLLLCSRVRAVRRQSIVVEQRLLPDGSLARHVKRVTAMEGDNVEGRIVPAGCVWLEGDNAVESTDSRQQGPLSRMSIVAVVIGVLRDGSLIDYVTHAR